MGDISLNILLLGGDERTIYLNRILKENGYNTSIHKTLDDSLKNCLMTTKFDVIVLPVPTRYKINDDKIYIKLGETYIKENLIPRDSYHVYASGDIDKYMGTAKNINLLKDEKFTFDNAYITAEAALCIMLNNKLKTIMHSKCLISGFGRIGSCLYKLLYPICDDITIATSNVTNHLLWANKTKTINYKELENIDKYDFVVNTVPQNIFGSLENLKGLYYELASPPYGFDYNKLFNTTDKMTNLKKTNNEKIVMCPALPAKYYPYDAAKVIYECMHRKIFSI
jgi:dipicolinate synthase subunit A